MSILVKSSFFEKKLIRALSSASSSKTAKGVIMPEKGRLFPILVSVAWHEIWCLGVDRILIHPGKIHSQLALHNQWLRSINASLNRDRILADKLRFGSLSLNKQLVLNTWSGLLLNEESLLDDWIHTKGVLVELLITSPRFTQLPSSFSRVPITALP
jgi:hypothetical protein